MKAIARFSATQPPQHNRFVADLIDRFRLWLRRAVAVGSLFAILALANTPTAVAAEESQDLTPEQLQSEIMRFVLRYQASMTQAFDKRIKAEDNAALRATLQETKLANLIGISNIVLQPYPEVNLLDLIVFLSLTETVWEKHWIPEYFGRKKGTPIVKLMQSFKTEAWDISKTYLTDDERAELAGLITAWEKKNRNIVYVEGVRFGDFAKEFADSALARRAKGAFLFSTVSEATAELSQMRLMGERYLFLAQTLPFTIRETVRLVTYDMMGEPEISRLLKYSKDATTQFERFNNIMDQLPEEIREEIAIQGKELFASLDGREDRLGELLTRTEHSIAQGRTLVEESHALASTIDGTVDKLTPFLVDAHQGAELFDNVKVTLNLARTTIQESENLLTSLESLMKQGQQSTSQQTFLKNIDVATTRIERLSNHLFWLLVALTVIVCITAVVGVLFYRLAASRMAYGARPHITKTKQQDELATDRGTHE